MSQITLGIRMDKEIKKRFDAFCADAGMNASIAVNMFARTVLWKNGYRLKSRAATIPFTASKTRLACGRR